VPDLFTSIATERRALVHALRTVDDAAWDTPSLCAGWRARDVLAHLTMPFAVRTPQFVVGMIANLGNYDRYAGRWATGEADARSPEELLATLEANADSRFTPPGFGAEAPLTDIVVHGLDLCVPLGIELGHGRVEVLRTVLGFLVSPKAGRVFRSSEVALDGRELVATDVGWRWGSGDPVAAPATALILGPTGRRPLEPSER
jgi:uncharacterized protein (TIGR03083 family)